NPLRGDLTHWEDGRLPLPSQWSPRDGGAGGGIRTHKGLRPEMCEISAFTGFATPAPFRLLTPAIPKAKTGHPTRAAARRATIRAQRHEFGIKKTQARAKSRAAYPGAVPRGERHSPIGAMTLIRRATPLARSPMPRPRSRAVPRDGPPAPARGPRVPR